MHLLGHCKWWVMGVRAIISNISEYPFSWNNQCDYWLMVVAPFGPVWLNIQMARWQKDCKRKFTKLEEHQVRVTVREKLQGGISFIWLTLPFFFFFFFSLTYTSIPWFSEISPNRYFNSRHAGVRGRGVQQLFKFYSQGEFTSKLPGPDGRIKGSGKEGCLL